MTIVPMLLLAPVLLAVVYCDLRFMRIPNSLSLIALAVIAIAALVFQPADLVARLIAAGVVLLLGGTAFAFRMVGGGDVKFLTVLMLAVPTGGLLVFANVFSVSMIVGIGVVLSLRRIPQTVNWGWKSFGGSQKFPMGLSIGLSGLAFPPVVMVLQSH